MSAEMSAPASGGVTLKINGGPLARVLHWEAGARQKPVPVWCLGSREPAAIFSEELLYTVELTRLLWEDDPADLYTLYNFTVDITENGRTFRYSGCRWSLILQKDDRALLWEKASFTAAHREEVTA